MSAEANGRRRLNLDVAEAIRGRILSGQYKAGDRLPSERDLVNEFACSRATIRLALERLISMQMVERLPKRGAVVRSSEDVGEVVGRAKSSKLVSIALPYVSWHMSVTRLCNAMQAVFAENSYKAIMCDCGYVSLGEGVKRDVEHIESLISRGVAGLVLWPAPRMHNLDVFQRAIEAGMAIALVDREIEGLDCDYVGVDNEAGAYQATQHLIQHGHTRICHVTHMVQATSLRDRSAGYTRALEEAGLEYDERLTLSSWPYQDVGRFDEALERMLSLPDRPTAMFCANDDLAGIAIAKLQRLGVMIPRDMAIVGFDDDLFAKWSPVPLTTVSQPFERMGEEAARLLMARLNGLAGPPKRVILPVKLMVRNSCGSHSHSVS